MVPGMLVERIPRKNKRAPLELDQFTKHLRRDNRKAMQQQRRADRSTKRSQSY